MVDDAVMQQEEQQQQQHDVPWGMPATVVQIAGRVMCPLTSDYFRGMALQSTYLIDINPYAMIGRRNTNGNLTVYQGESAFAMETGYQS